MNGVLAKSVVGSVAAVPGEGCGARLGTGARFKPVQFAGDAGSS